MKSQNIISPEDQRVSFVELFFDLVFVFSVTQVVSFFHDGVDWIAVGQAVLVFWLVWWAWTQFTWSLNAADTTHHTVVLSVLVATAVTFFMAVALPGAFQEKSAWFAIAYVLVRIIGLTVNALAASGNSAQWAAVRTFSLISIGGLVAVLGGGFIGGTAQYWLWGLAIVFDVFATGVGGQMEGWDLNAEHFGERHGLFIIIALGETLIVAAGGVSSTVWTNDLLIVSAVTVALTCGLWWSYFIRAKPVLDEALETHRSIDQTQIACDVFSLLHFLIICGVIAYAVAVEEVVAHPSEALSLVARGSLAVALLLFVGGTAVAVWRAKGQLLLPRVTLVGVTAVAVVGVTAVTALFTLLIALIGVIVITVLEQQKEL